MHTYKAEEYNAKGIRWPQTWNEERECEYVAQLWRDGRQIGQCVFDAVSVGHAEFEAMRIQQDECRATIEGNAPEVRLIIREPRRVGSVVKLPARNSRQFAALPAVVRELLHSAHRIQFQLRTQAHKLSEERKAELRAGLLRCVELAETLSARFSLQLAGLPVLPETY